MIVSAECLFEDRQPLMKPKKKVVYPKKTVTLRKPTRRCRSVRGGVPGYLIYARRAGIMTVGGRRAEEETIKEDARPKEEA